MRECVNGLAQGDQKAQYGIFEADRAGTEKAKTDRFGVGIDPHSEFTFDQDAASHDDVDYETRGEADKPLRGHAAKLTSIFPFITKRWTETKSMKLGDTQSMSWCLCLILVQLLLSIR